MKGRAAAEVGHWNLEAIAMPVRRAGRGGVHTAPTGWPAASSMKLLGWDGNLAMVVAGVGFEPTTFRL